MIRASRQSTSRHPMRRVAGALAFAALIAASLFAATADDYRKRQETLDAELAAEHYALGLWALEQKLTSEAREQFEQAVQLNPNYKEAAAKLAELTGSIRRSKNPKCEFEMLTGEKVKAELLMPGLRVQTPAGFLLISTTEIDVIELSPPPGSDKILSDAFIGDGRVKTDTFSAQSMVGPISVKRIDVKSVRIFRPCAACDGAGQSVCRRCSGTGKVSDKSVCPDCGGKGKVKCRTCDGKGKITCPLCGGSGRISGAWGRFRRMDCPRCQGTGSLNCPDCNGAGGTVCPTCKGKPASAKAGPCPVCNGAKIIQCTVCGGTGIRPLPKPENAEEPKPTEGATPPAETQPPAEGTPPDTHTVEEKRP